DFSYAVDGELVYVGIVCQRDRRNADGGCGCGRAFSGLASARATTTAEVREMDCSRSELIQAFGDGLDRQGWGAENGEAALNDVLLITTPLAVGTVVERR